MDRILFYRSEVEGAWIYKFFENKGAYALREEVTKKFLQGDCSRVSGLYVWVAKSRIFWFAPWDQKRQVLCDSFPVTEKEVPAEIKLKILLLAV